MSDSPALGDHGVYVHVPWCRSVCPYCGFYVVRDDGKAPFDRYVDRVLEESDGWSSAFPGLARSVFLGGGTPSRLPSPALRRLLAGLPRAPAAEIGVEANPDDVDGAWLDAALEAGITRVSIGVQSFQERPARRLGRAHTLDQARAAIARVAGSGVRSWSLDLIFAVPDQTLADFDRDLDEALATGAPHVSLYGLTYEPGTPLERLRDRGRLEPATDDLWREMYDLAVARLGSAGIERYEVSNFARPGHRSVHNEGYWEGRPYLGLGPSAHGFAADGRRWVNRPDLGAWLAGAPPEIERPEGAEAAADLLLAGLRRVEGLDLAVLARRTGHAPPAASVDRLVAGGLLQRVGVGGIALTADGFPVADAVVLRLVGDLRPASSDDPWMTPRSEAG